MQNFSTPIMLSVWCSVQKNVYKSMSFTVNELEKHIGIWIMSIILLTLTLTLTLNNIIDNNTLTLCTKCACTLEPRHWLWNKGSFWYKRIYINAEIYTELQDDPKLVIINNNKSTFLIKNKNSCSVGLMLISYFPPLVTALHNSFLLKNVIEYFTIYWTINLSKSINYMAVKKRKRKIIFDLRVGHNWWHKTSKTNAIVSFCFDNTHMIIFSYHMHHITN